MKRYNIVISFEVEAKNLEEAGSKLSELTTKDAYDLEISELSEEEEDTE